MSDMAEQLYREAFCADAGELVVSEAPGRVNIIGEHTDYNEGFVLPMPIDRYMWAAAKRRGDNAVHLFAADYREWTTFDPDDIKFDEEHSWANYILGVARAMVLKGHKIRGANMVIWGDIPQGAGLGSSGALEMAAVRAFTELFGFEIDPIEMAYIGKSAENDFVGVRSGIMDQFASVLGRPSHALFIDCRTND
jgi:galactokinase